MISWLSIINDFYTDWVADRFLSSIFFTASTRSGDTQTLTSTCPDLMRASLARLFSSFFGIGILIAQCWLLFYVVGDETITCAIPCWAVMRKTLTKLTFISHNGSDSFAALIATTAASVQLLKSSSAYCFFDFVDAHLNHLSHFGAALLLHPCVYNLMVTRYRQ